MQRADNNVAGRRGDVGLTADIRIDVRLDAGASEHRSERKSAHGETEHVRVGVSFGQRIDTHVSAHCNRSPSLHVGANRRRDVDIGKVRRAAESKPADDGGGVRVRIDVDIGHDRDIVYRTIRVLPDIGVANVGESRPVGDNPVERRAKRPHSNLSLFRFTHESLRSGGRDEHSVRIDNVGSGTDVRTLRTEVLDLIHGRTERDETEAACQCRSVGDFIQLCSNDDIAASTSRTGNESRCVAGQLGDDDRGASADHANADSTGRRLETHILQRPNTDVVARGERRLKTDDRANAERRGGVVNRAGNLALRRGTGRNRTAGRLHRRVDTGIVRTAAGVVTRQRR